MIPQLVGTPRGVEVQETSFSIDVLGRYVCSTWDEAVQNGGAPFDVVVLGAGMFGAYTAQKIYRDGAAAGLRVLVLEAGPFLVSEHVQNLARIGLNPAGPVAHDPGHARERVWGLPWRSNVPFTGLAYAIGGRSLYWGGWAPRMTEADLARWPPEVASYLREAWAQTEREIGAEETTDYISGPLYRELKRKFEAAAKGVPTIDGVEEAPLAVQGKPPASGLFSFDKYSSAPLLCDAVREAARKPDHERRLFVVPRTHVIRLHRDGALVTALECQVNGERKTLHLAPHASVVLALGTIESTRLALESFPRTTMGRNLMIHLRTNLTVRIRRSAFDDLPKELEAAALLVRGSTPAGQYHIQVTASATLGTNAEETMWRMIPDIDLVDRMVEGSREPEWIALTLRGIGETVGSTGSPTPETSWIDLSPHERDENGARRAWVNLRPSPNDDPLFNDMFTASMSLARKLAREEPTNIQYLVDGKWSPVAPPDLGRRVRDGYGTTHHEAGTLWMGADPATSITDLHGRFHHVANAWVVGPATFPVMGSANPALPATALSRRTAAAIVREAASAVEPGFRRLDTDPGAWRLSGAGGFRFGRLVDADGGPGILWFAREAFGDFVLRLEYRTTSADDNSGIFLRIPPLGDDWRPAILGGFEMQIDDRGLDHETGAYNHPLRKTGAIYDLAPVKKDAARPPGTWNECEIEAVLDRITVRLNGQVVSTLVGDHGRGRRGHIGLQAHHEGSRVQFRNIRVKPA